MNENRKMKFKIGEFSGLGRVTVRTLRHYEDIGLLEPDIVDRWTGYRYYSADQLQKLLAIGKLKSLGFTLAEIRNLYEADTHRPDAHALEDKLRECEQELIRLQHRRDQLQSLLSAQKKTETMNKIFFDTLPSIIVASSRFTIHSYDDLGPHLVGVIAPEMARLGCQCPEPGYCFTTETAGEYRPHDFEIEYCEQVTALGTDSDIIQFKTLPAVPEAICMKVYGPYERLKDSYQELFAAIASEGYIPVGNHRASYVDGIWNEEDPEKWLTIIQAPVRKAE